MRPLAVMGLMAALTVGASFYADSYIEARRSAGSADADPVPQGHAADAARAADRYMELSSAGLRPAFLGIGPFALQESDIVAAGYMVADRRGRAAYLGHDGIWSHEDLLADREAMRAVIGAHVTGRMAAWAEEGVALAGTDMVLPDPTRLVSWIVVDDTGTRTHMFLDGLGMPASEYPTSLFSIESENARRALR